MEPGVDTRERCRGSHVWLPMSLKTALSKSFENLEPGAVTLWCVDRLSKSFHRAESEVTVFVWVVR